MFWQITSFPRCEFHAFLSHCAADRRQLVYPVYEELKRKAVIPWLDKENYYYGRGSRTALRDGLLRSRHVVFFVTPGMMRYCRGWCQMELAYSDLMQANFAYAGGPVLHFELPLFFISQADSRLPRSSWNDLRGQGPFHKPSHGNRVTWAVDQIIKFLHREQSLALDMVKAVTPGSAIHSSLLNQSGLIERVTQFDPGAIP